MFFDLFVDWATFNLRIYWLESPYPLH